MRLGEDGALEVTSGGATLRYEAPAAWQPTRASASRCACAFALRGVGEVGFELVGRYDADRPLVIETAVAPTAPADTPGGQDGSKTQIDTVWSSAQGMGADGSSYVAGFTASSAFPIAAGSFDTTENGDMDVFVAAAAAASTFLGGSGFDQALRGIAVDASGRPM